MKWLPVVVLAACAAGPFDPVGNGIIVEAFTPPDTWRSIYEQVESCAGRPQGQYDGIRWFWVDGTNGGPWQGENGNTYGMTIPEDRRIYLIHGDTTYLRHEMLHDVLFQSGWRPTPSGPNGTFTRSDLHPAPPFGLCTGGR